MRPRDPNLPMLESVARALGPLCKRFVFVGGCASGLLVTDSAAPPARTTQDVDVIVEVLSLAEYHKLEHELIGAGFQHDRSQDAPVCRWIVGAALMDVMPTDERVLGFGNRWYEAAARSAEMFVLPSGREIRLINPALFLATKLDAFAGRGGSDYSASHDLEDVVALVDGRPELVNEVGASQDYVRQFLAAQVATLLSDSSFMQALPGHLPGDETSQARVPIVTSRLRQIAELLVSGQPRTTR